MEAAGRVESRKQRLLHLTQRLEIMKKVELQMAGDKHTAIPLETENDLNEHIKKLEEKLGESTNKAETTQKHFKQSIESSNSAMVRNTRNFIMKGKYSRKNSSFCKKYSGTSGLSSRTWRKSLII